MNLNDFIVKYAVSFSFRKSLKQKARLLGVLNLEFGAYGYPVKGISEKKKGIVSLNIHIGDVNKAKTLIVAPYDMPPRRFFTKGYHPLHEVDSVFVKLFSENIIFLSTLMLAFMAYWLTKDINLNLSYILLAILTGVNLVLTYRFPMGLNCKYTANKNNSSLAVILKMAESLKGQKDIAFVLLDHSSLNHHGEMMLSILLANRKEEPLVIYLDCVGYGDQGMVFSSVDNVNIAKSFISKADSSLSFENIAIESNEIQKTVLSRFPRSILISVGVVNQQWVVPKVRTSKDMELSETVVSAVANMVMKSIEHS